ncbi:iron chelate uptake ABC transporter family permease subunit [Cellulomonas sp. SLBN-39]|uniref:FecCD family ABC transporter permease n=1 Tax=Cellulomonas sp. SLBN-39 TaxID=2768446 RepID=UPI00116E7149|nr:iron chelate uptake ABC transporter family permease subunit [Cellulomonas sp. SLBN-39]TQL02499.1 iron complex transport system permease protein [Cellulomonas sp. SLBN-39]
MSGTAPRAADAPVHDPVPLPGRVLRAGGSSVRWHPRTWAVCAALLAAAAALAVIAMGDGTIALTPAQVLGALTGAAEDRTVERVVLGIRLPRLVTGLGVGAALGVAGALFQSLSRNALGSPDLIGLTTGAATGAVLQIVLGGGTSGPLAVGAAAVLGGTATAVVVQALARTGRSGGGYRMVLVGIGVGAFLQAVSSVLLTRAELDQALEAEIWLQGSLAGRSWQQAVPVLVVLAVVLPLLPAVRRDADVLEMGDETAAQLGVVAARARRTQVVLGVALTAVATAAAGPVAFVALAAPQLVRRLTGATGAHLGPSACLGAALLLAADLLSRHLPFAWSVPVGLATALLGGLYLVWLLSRKDPR